MSNITLVSAVTERDHHRGIFGSRAVLVEYGDFECPHCAKAFPELEAIKHEFGTSLCFVYRHFPLRTMHPNAELAAIASEAADQQENFWQMHHLLFQHYDSLSLPQILMFAETLELDLELFQHDLKRPDLRERIEDDFAGGFRSGVQGTPSLFLNGERFEGPTTFEALVHPIADKLSMPSDLEL